MSLTPMQQIVADVYTSFGLPPELGLGTGEWESAHSWNPNLATMTGGDGARGGSYGIMQMSLKTAQNLDRTATVARLMNPKYNATLAAMLHKQDWRRCRGVVEDVIAMYNSGKPFWAAPEDTKLIYVPHVLKYMAEFKAKLAAMASDTASAPSGSAATPSSALP